MTDLKFFAAGDGNAAKRFSFINGTASPFVPTIPAVPCSNVRHRCFFGDYR
jgi:hypothetical protein